MSDSSTMQDPRTPEEVAAAIKQFRAGYASVKEQVGRAVVGQNEAIDGVLTCLFTGGHVLLEGVPGLGKTLLIRSLAQALSLDFSRIQFTPDLMPADISGTTIVMEAEQPDGTRRREFQFQQGPIFAQIVLADEINRATPKTQSALLEAMQERSVTVGTETYKLDAPFLVMATQNPIEQEGTYPLPEAQLDRFAFKLVVGYSSRADMSEILNRTTAGTSPTIEPVMNAESIITWQKLVRRAAIAPHIQDYAVRLVLATHPPGPASEGTYATPMVAKFVQIGASPRAAQAIVLAAKCRALLDGRASVSIDDIKSVALPALRHRVALNFDAHAESLTSDQVISNILDTVPIQAEMPVQA